MDSLRNTKTNEGFSNFQDSGISRTLKFLMTMRIQNLGISTFHNTGIIKSSNSANLVPLKQNEIQATHLHT